MIDEEQIRAVAMDAAYKRGVRYFRRGAVGHLERQEDGRSYTAVVEGTEAYHVRISLTGAGDEVESFHCDCPAAAQYLGACKHVVAVLKTVQQQSMAGGSSPGTDAGGRRLLQSFSWRRSCHLLRCRSPSTSSRASSSRVRQAGSRAGSSSASA